MDQNFYKLGGSYYTADNNQKVADLAQLQSLAKAGGKEISAPVQQGAVAIPGAQYATKEAQQAAFTNITPVGGTLYGVPKVAESLTSDQLTGKTSTIPTATTETKYSPEAFVTGSNQYLQGVMADITSQQKAQQDLINKQTEQRQSVSDLISQIGGKGAEYQTELEKYNYTPNITQLQEINKQIAAKTAEFNKMSVDNQGRPVMTSMIGGQESLIRRQQASEVGALTAVAQVLQGNISLAQETAQKSVDLKYEPLETQLKQQQAQLEYIYEDLSRADKLKADAQATVLAERQRLLEQQKETETNINNVMLTAAQNGADVNTLNKIKNSKTLSEAIVNSKDFLVDETGKWTIETDENGIPFKFNATTGQMERLDGTSMTPTTETMSIVGADAKSIANAIKQVESGGNYEAKGASGENGAYQFMPATWNSWSREYAKATLGVDTPLSMSKQNQDFVAQFKIQQWLDNGLTPQQIAAKWNSGSEIGWENKVGVNSKGVKYDVPGYVKKVVNALSTQPGVSTGVQASAENITEDGYDVSKFTQKFYNTTLGQKVLNNEEQKFNAFKGEQIVKDFNAAQAKAASIQSILDRGASGTGDMSLVFEYMKALDPTSVVREGEFKTAAKSGNPFWELYAKMGGYVNKGEILPQSVREEFAKLSNTKLGVVEKQYNNLRDEYRRIAYQQGLNPNNVTPDLTVDYGSQESAESNWLAQQGLTSATTPTTISQTQYSEQPKQSVWNNVRSWLGLSPQKSAIETYSDIINKAK